MNYIYNYIKKYSDIEEDSEDILKFGINMLKMVLSASVIAVIIAIGMGMLPEATVFLVTLIPLRQNAGGYHAKHSATCAIISVVIYVGMLFAIKNYSFNMIFQLILCTINSIVIILLAPVDNSNNELDEKEHRVYKYRTINIFMVELIIFMLLFISGLQYWCSIIMISVTVISVLLCVGWIQNMLEKGRI